MRAPITTCEGKGRVAPEVRGPPIERALQGLRPLVFGSSRAFFLGDGTVGQCVTWMGQQNIIGSNLIMEFCSSQILLGNNEIRDPNEVIK